MSRRERRKLQAAMHSAQRPHLCGVEQPVPPVLEPSDVPALKPVHSTGPVTAEGKAISSRNAVKHGLCAKKLSGAALEELNAIRTRLDQEWEPSTETERLLVQQMALSQWRLDRALEIELGAFDGEIDPAALALALRYRTSAERSFYKALAELQRLRTSMREDALREARRQREEETDALRCLEAQILGPKPGPPQFVSQDWGGGLETNHFGSQKHPHPPEDAQYGSGPRTK